MRAWALLASSLAMMAPLSMASNEEGLAFLAEKKAEADVVELPSGVLYKVLRKGSGTWHPKEDTTCSMHYHGTLIDGEVFDSSMDRGMPIDFAPNQVIKAWTEVMQLMVEGDLWEIYSPSELAYGERGSPPKIPPSSVLVFKMEMLQIKGDKVPALKCNPETLDECNEREISYSEKAKSMDIPSEIKRLEGMLGNKMKPELIEWMNRRLNILRQLPLSSKEEL